MEEALGGRPQNLYPLATTCLSSPKDTGVMVQPDPSEMLVHILCQETMLSRDIVASL